MQLFQIVLPLHGAETKDKGYIEKFLKKIWEWGSGPPLFFTVPALPTPGVYGANRHWLMGEGGWSAADKPSRYKG